MWLSRMLPSFWNLKKNDGDQKKRNKLTSLMSKYLAKRPTVLWSQAINLTISHAKSNHKWYTVYISFPVFAVAAVLWNVKTQKSNNAWDLCYILKYFVSGTCNNKRLSNSNCCMVTTELIISVKLTMNHHIVAFWTSSWNFVHVWASLQRSIQSRCLNISYKTPAGRWTNEFSNLCDIQIIIGLLTIEHSIYS